MSRDVFKKGAGAAPFYHLGPEKLPIRAKKAKFDNIYVILLNKLWK